LLKGNLSALLSSAIDSSTITSRQLSSEQNDEVDGRIAQTGAIRGRRANQLK
jgi:hypothetical protein